MNYRIFAVVKEWEIRSKKWQFLCLLQRAAYYLLPRVDPGPLSRAPHTSTRDSSPFIVGSWHPFWLLNLVLSPTCFTSAGWAPSYMTTSWNWFPETEILHLAHTTNKWPPTCSLQLTSQHTLPPLGAAPLEESFCHKLLHPFTLRWSHTFAHLCPHTQARLKNTIVLVRLTSLSRAGQDTALLSIAMRSVILGCQLDT